MNPLLLPKLLLSPSAGWEELARSAPNLRTLFLQLILPLSLLPPALLYLAGSRYGDAFVEGWSGRDWPLVAALLFVAEMAAIPAMAAFIGFVARGQQARCERQRTFTLAAIAPVPLWLSALFLLIPSPYLNLMTGFIALLTSAGLIYRGVRVILEVRDEEEALLIAGIIFTAGLLVWAMLLVLLLLV